MYFLWHFRDLEEAPDDPDWWTQETRLGQSALEKCDFEKQAQGSGEVIFCLSSNASVPRNPLSPCQIQSSIEGLMVCSTISSAILLTGLETNFFFFQPNPFTKTLKQDMTFGISYFWPS